MTITNNELTKIVHVVGNIDRALAKFSSLFGMEKPSVVATGAPDKDNPKVFTRFRGSDIAGRVKLANLKMGPVTVELIEPVDEESPWAEFYRDHGEGIFSLVFTVKDFDAHIERLAQEGMPIYHHGEYGTGRYAYFESRDQVGVTICVQEIDG